MSKQDELVSVGTIDQKVEAVEWVIQYGAPLHGKMTVEAPNKAEAHAAALLANPGDDILTVTRKGCADGRMRHGIARDLEVARAAARDLASELESERANNSELRDIIEDLERQLRTTRQERDKARASVAQYEAEAAHAPYARRVRHERATSDSVTARSNAATETLVIMAGSPLDRTQALILSLLDGGSMGGVKMASYLAEAVECVAVDTLGVTL